MLIEVELVSAIKTLSKDQIIIPIEIREKLGIKPGQMLDARY